MAHSLGIASMMLAAFAKAAIWWNLSQLKENDHRLSYLFYNFLHHQQLSVKEIIKIIVLLSQDLITPNTFLCFSFFLLIIDCLYLNLESWLKLGIAIDFTPLVSLKKEISYLHQLPLNPLRHNIIPKSFTP